MIEGNQDKLVLNATEGQTLLALARHSIATRLGIRSDVDAEKELAAKLNQSIFDARGGTFVTLKKKGQLRGCIGNLGADESLQAGIRRNAMNAAFRDPRFSPLTASEISETDIEISILSPPLPLAYTDADDLCRRLQPGVHGVVLQHGSAGATFLPQVWEQLPTPEVFLSQLCLKAGLAANTWRHEKVEILIYTVQHFEE